MLSNKVPKATLRVRRSLVSLKFIYITSILLAPLKCDGYSTYDSFASNRGAHG